MAISRDVFEKPSQHKPRFIAPHGLSEHVVRLISKSKNEPLWMLEKRLFGLKKFFETPLPAWGPSLAHLDLESISYFVQANAAESRSWEDVPEEIRKTFTDLGIPEAEQKALGGVGAQYDSEMVYHRLKDDLSAKGVVFENMDVAVEKYPDMVREYFMTGCVPVHDHKFTMLHAAVWSGGTFIYVPRGVSVEIPLQAYFRMNTRGGGQFEHTLIIADEGSTVHYIEGCSAPKFDTAALHAGCVEIYVKKGAKVQYSSIENWSKNTFNLNTKRSVVDEDGSIEWLNGNMGSGVTMLYPMSILRGQRARSDYLGIAFAGPGQIQDTGHKVVLLSPDTSATVRSRSISAGGGQSIYRGLVKVMPKAINSKTSVRCDALIMDSASISKTIPKLEVFTKEATVVHEATVGKISESALFYLESRGLDKSNATRVLVGGFLEPAIKALPLEYAIELQKLIELEMEGVV